MIKSRNLVQDFTGSARPEPITLFTLTITSAFTEYLTHKSSVCNLSSVVLYLFIYFSVQQSWMTNGGYLCETRLGFF